MNIADPSFAKLVENYVLKNDPKFSRALAAQSHIVPKVFKLPQLAYRGMILDKDLLEAIKTGYRYPLKEPSSWTLDFNMANRFVTDPSKRIGHKNGTGVIFRKRLSENMIVLNIQAFALFFDHIEMDELTQQMAREEAEVLAKPLHLTRTDVYRVTP